MCVWESEFRALVKLSVRSYLVGNAGSRPISEAKQPWACLVLGWGTTGEAHVLYSLPSSKIYTSVGYRRRLAGCQTRPIFPILLNPREHPRYRINSYLVSPITCKDHIYFLGVERVQGNPCSRHSRRFAVWIYTQPVNTLGPQGYIQEYQYIWLYLYIFQSVYMTISTEHHSVWIRRTDCVSLVHRSYFILYIYIYIYIYVYIYVRLWPATNIKDARMSVCLVVWVYIDGRRLFMRSDFYYWLTTVVIVTVLFGLFIEFLWTTAKVPDIVCRIPDITGYPKYCRIIRHCRISGTSLNCA